jgi:hypothetical protein
MGKEDSGSDSDGAEIGGALMVNVTEGGWTKVKGKLGKKRITPEDKKLSPGTLIPKAQALEYMQMSEEQLLDHLREKEQVRREERKKPKFLSDDEKNLSLAKLDRKWREKDRLEKLLRQQENQDDLGTLSLDERKLPKNEIKAILRQRKYEAWVRRMQAKGVTLTECPICHELGTSGHRCMQMPWTLAGRKGFIPVHDGLVVSHKGGGDVRLRKLQQVDQERLQKQYEALTEQKQQAEAQQLRISKLLQPPEQDTSMQVVIDTNMEGSLDPLPAHVNSIISNNDHYPAVNLSTSSRWPRSFSHGALLSQSI